MRISNSFFFSHFSFTLLNTKRKYNQRRNDDDNPGPRSNLFDFDQLLISTENESIEETRVSQTLKAGKDKKIKYQGIF